MLKTLAEFPATVPAEPSCNAPHRIARYLEDLAGAACTFRDDGQIKQKRT